MTNEMENSSSLGAAGGAGAGAVAAPGHDGGDDNSDAASSRLLDPALRVHQGSRRRRTAGGGGSSSSSSSSKSHSRSSSPPDISSSSTAKTVAAGPSSASAPSQQEVVAAAPPAAAAAAAAPTTAPAAAPPGLPPLPLKKKRGRPSKRDKELREQQEAALRAEQEMFLLSSAASASEYARGGAQQHVRKSSEDDGPDGGDARNGKRSKRKKVTKACIFCKRSHMTCTENRPCDRCIKRDIAHLCTDAPSASDAGPSGGASGVASSSKSPSTAAVQLTSLASHSQQAQAQAQASPDISSSRVHESGSSGRQGLSLPTAAANRSPSLLDRAQLHSSVSASASTSALPGGSGSNIFGSPDAIAAEFAHPGLPQQQRQQSQSQSQAQAQLSTDVHARRKTLERGDSYAQQHDAEPRPSPGFAQGSSVSGGTTGSAQYSGQQQQQQQQQQQNTFNPFALLNQAYDYSYPSNNAGSNSLASLRLFASTADAQFGGLFGGNSGGSSDINGQSTGVGAINASRYPQGGAQAGSHAYGMGSSSLGLLGLGTPGPSGGSDNGTGSDIDSNALDDFLRTLDEMYLNPMPDVTQPIPTPSQSNLLSSASAQGTSNSLPAGFFTSNYPTANQYGQAPQVQNPSQGQHQTASAQPSSQSHSNLRSPSRGGTASGLSNEISALFASAPPSRAVSPASELHGARHGTAPSGQSQSRPGGPGRTSTERFLLTAADQKEGTRDERLNKVIRAKYNAGLLKPFNYIKGYERLNTWMERKWSQSSKLRTLRIISEFRPAFRAIAQGLTDLDLIFIEEAFERLLLDCDRLFSTMGIPACLWRRTGEIFKGNREFAELIGIPYDKFRDGNLAIYELMAEDSAVNFWEKYGSIAFDPGQKAVLTSCVLINQTKLKGYTDENRLNGGSSIKRLDSNLSAGSGAGSAGGGGGPPRRTDSTLSNSNLTRLDSNLSTLSAGTAAAPPLTAQHAIALADIPEEALVHCTFSFTIRRDAYHIPNAIVGNFMPVNP